MISICISIVFFCLQWLQKSYISKLLRTDFSITSPIISPCPTRVVAVDPLKNKRCYNQVFFCLSTVSDLIPDLERSGGSSPQASCHLSLVFPSFIVSQSHRVPLIRGKTFRHTGKEHQTTIALFLL